MAAKQITIKRALTLRDPCPHCGAVGQLDRDHYGTVYCVSCGMQDYSDSQAFKVFVPEFVYYRDGRREWRRR